MVRVLVRRDFVEKMKELLKEVQEEVEWDFYEGEGYKEKMLSEKWDVVLGEKILDLEDTIFVDDFKTLLLGVQLAVKKKECDRLRSKYALLFYTPELQGSVIKRTLFQVQKYYNSYNVFALVAEKGVHKHAYVEFVTNGEYVQLTYHDKISFSKNSATLFIDDVPSDFRVPEISGRKIVLGMETVPRDLPYVFVPPLRERKADIPYMLDGVLKSLQLKGKVVKVDEDLLDLLMNYHWPGNTQEFLEKVHLILLEGDPFEQVKILLENVEKISTLNFKEFMDAAVSYIEKRVIEKALEESGGSRRKACEMLGMNYKTLSYKVKKYGLD